MLKSMRQNARYFYFLFVIVIISFIFWGVGNQDDGKIVVIAEVEGYKVTADEYWRSYENARETYRQLFKDQNNEDFEKNLNLKEMILNSLIEQKVLLALADEMKISVTDKELQEAIISDSRFIRDGIFRKEIYLRTLEINRIRPEQFEKSLRQQLIISKLGRYIESSLSSIKDKEDQMKQANINAYAVKSFIDQAKNKMKIKIDKSHIS
ncbi:MAG TPA: SurA N-terminal domain-containing protein [Nitrospirae bacterium]|nr:SurA N-terminal domain-containing protein [Nitrospirota bacterium]